MIQSNNHSVLKLIWCSPHPNHYNSYLFEHLSSIPDVSFEAVYFQKKLANYPWTSSFEGAYPVCYLKKTAGIDIGFIWRRWKAKKELLIIAGWNEPTMLVLLMVLVCTRRKFILFSDTPRIRTTKNVREYLRKYMLDIVFNRVYKFLVTGTTGIEKAKLLGIQESKLVNFPFTTNTEFFVPLNNKQRSLPLVILSSGRLDNAHKGYDIGIKALGKLKKAYPHLPFRYLLAGEGPDKKALELLIQSNGLSEEVVLKGWLEPKDLLSFYHSGDLFLHPSHEDPFPNAVLEAMSCGLPVIGSDAAGSVKDRIEDGRNGYQHRDGDVEDVCNKLVSAMMLSSEQLRKMSLLARETALQWKVSYHTEVIKKIVKEKDNTEV